MCVWVYVWVGVDVASSADGHCGRTAGAGGDSEAAAARLAADPRWPGSGFQELESFIFRFLSGAAGGGGEGGGGGAGPSEGRGGAAAVGGESVRLKLQTPLFVADALLDAAGAQLGAEEELAQKVRGRRGGRGGGQASQ